LCRGIAMIHYTVLIPQRDATDAVRHLVPQLERELDKLVLPYEIICIDDASAAPALGTLEELVCDSSRVRVLRFDEPRGTSAALSAGLFAARGDLIIAMAPDREWAVPFIPQLIARLSQNDFVFALRERSLAREVRSRAGGLRRVLAADPQLHSAEDLFWAARREAVARLALARGAFRMLPGLMARRGFRTCRLTLAEGLPPRGAAFHPGMLQRQVIRWLDRRFEPHLALELVRNDAPQPRLSVARVDLSRARFVPQAAFAPAETEHRDSA
jgi:hypothetical protein